jgi:Flp pilus assembly pilin Flp
MIKPHLSQKGLHLRSLANKRGQTLVEYALILALISVVAVSTLMAMGGQVASTYTTINRQLASAQDGGASAPARSH